MKTPKIIQTVDDEVIPLEELRQQCEIVTTEIDSDGEESHPDDALIRGYLLAAVAFAEKFTGKAIARRIYEFGLDNFPCRGGAIEIPRPPLIEIISFTSEPGSDGQVEPSLYSVDDLGDVARICCVGVAWPYQPNATNAIRVRFEAGYGDDSDGAEPLPANIKQALLLTVADWYKNREATVDGSLQELPIGALVLLRQDRVRLGMA